MWRGNGNPNPYTVLDKILHPHPHLFKEGFSANLIPAHSPLGLGGLKHYNLKETFLKTVYKVKDIQQVAN